MGCLAIRERSSRRSCGGPSRAAEAACRLRSPGGTWPQDAEIAKKDLLTTGPWLCRGEAAASINRVMSPEHPAGTDLKFFLGDLCVSANLAMNLPETVSICAASQTLALRRPPERLAVNRRSRSRENKEVTSLDMGDPGHKRHRRGPASLRQRLADLSQADKGRIGFELP